MVTPSVSRGKFLILVVDDQPDTLDILEEALLYYGFRVVAARSKEHALEVCGNLKEVPHAIVTDYFLGDGTGAELVIQLGKKAPEVRILVSGSTELSTNRAFDFFLVKPVIIDNLCTLLDTFLLMAAAS